MAKETFYPQKKFFQNRSCPSLSHWLSVLLIQPVLWRIFLIFWSWFKFLAKQRSPFLLGVPIAMVICAIHLTINRGRPCIVAYLKIVLAINFSYILPGSQGRPEVSVGQEVFYLFAQGITWQLGHRRCPGETCWIQFFSSSLSASFNSCERA